MAKASETYSSVPNIIRDKFREYKKREREAEMEREQKSRDSAPMQSTPSAEDRKALDELVRGTADTRDAANRGRNKPMSENDFENERRQLMETIDQDNAATDQEMYRGKGYRKGGMVKAKKSRSGRGDGCATRGFTKGRMY